MFNCNKTAYIGPDKGGQLNRFCIKSLYHVKGSIHLFEFITYQLLCAQYPGHQLP